MKDGLDYYPIELESPTFVVRNGRRIYRKQVMYVTRYSKQVQPGDWKTWDIDEAFIDNWVQQGSLFLSRGIEIPCPKGHTTDPELKRAKCVGLEKALDHKGRPSLYAYLEFLNDEAEESLKNSNVSIHSVPSFEDSQRNKYTWPVMHIAFTDYPVIPDLEPFEAIAASLIDEEKLSMNEFLQQIAEALGVDLTEDADDNAALNVILNAIKALKEKAGIEDTTAGDAGSDAGGGDQAVAASVPAFVLGLARDNRTMKIDGLLSGKHITPASAKKLKEQWCTGAITLSQDGSDTQFDSVVEALKLNTAVHGESTGPQTTKAITLAHEMPKGDGGSGDKQVSPTLRNAQARANKFQKTGRI